MASKKLEGKQWCFYFILFILGTVIFLSLLERVNRREVYDVYSRRPKEDSKKHAALVAELQTLSQIVNKTVEEVAQEVLDQQAVIKEGFCNSG